MKRFIKYCLFTLIILTGSARANAQVVNEPVSNNFIYDLLDELAAVKVITLNSVVKPYSRTFIAQKLSEARAHSDKLSKRQLEEISFYLKDFNFDILNPVIPSLHTRADSVHAATFQINPLSFRLNTDLFKLSISPELGSRFMINENGNFIEVSGGGSVYGYFTKHIGYSFNVIHVHQNEPLVNPLMFSMEEGKSWNYLSDGSVYNTEWTGGLSVAWRWGDFGIYKDRPVWGNALHGSNIMSGHAPSFPYLQLHFKPAKWIEFYCIDAVLESNVVDSSRSSFTPGSENIQFHKKYMAANIITFTPWKGLDISLGNSIFWSDVIKVGYLIPFNLYKSVDQTLKGATGYESGYNTNDDGHLFIDVSSRNIRHLHLYAGLWIDDWVSSYLLDPNKHNCLSWKLGASIYDLPVRNLSLLLEGSINRPRVYQEYNPANAYSNDDYNLGNYLQDDSWEFYACLNYKPIRGLSITASFDIAQRGGFVYMKDDYSTYPLSKNLVFNQTHFGINAAYMITTDLKVYAGWQYNQHSGDIQYIPQLLRGNTNSALVGFNMGF